MRSCVKQTLLSVVAGVFFGCMPVYSPTFDDQQESRRLVDAGLGYLRSGDLESAHSNFLLASELITSAAAIDGLGCIAFLRGQLEEAERYFWQAYEVDAQYNNSLSNLALLYETQGDIERAESLYKQALAQDPRNFRLRNNYAAFLAEKKGINEGAYTELSKAKALFNHPVIYDNINILKER